MNWLSKGWQFLSGKKTVIGGAVLIAGKLVTLFEPAVGAVVIEAGEWIIGLGIADKLRKKTIKDKK